MRTFQVSVWTAAASYITVLALVMQGAEASAADAQVVAPFVNDDTFVVGQCNLPALVKQMQASGGKLPALLGSDMEDIGKALEGLQQAATALEAAGVTHIYVVAGLGDVHLQGGPLVALETRAGAKAADVATTVKALVGQLGAEGGAIDARTHGANLVVVGRGATLDRYALLASSARPELVDPLEKVMAGGAAVAVAGSPGPDFRRVVRELWPTLSGALAPLRGALADQWRHVEVVAVPAAGDPAHISLVAADSASAEVFATLWKSLPEVVQQLKGEKAVVDQARSIVAAVPVVIDGPRATLAMPSESAQLDELRNLVQGAVDASQASTRAQERMLRLRDVGLAIHNYASEKKQLPPTAIRGKEGQPLLSWRVAILPYLGQAELYQQFHLDEPWDSPHNRTLIAKMPAVFADPDARQREQARSGRTTFQLPVGGETVFSADEPVRWTDLTDGTAKTLLVVEVEPSRAVEWTKPADWDVDLARLMDGVDENPRGHFAATFADGHVEMIPVSVEPAKLKGLLTRGGGENFDWP